MNVTSTRAAAPPTDGLARELRVDRLGVVAAHLAAAVAAMEHGRARVQELHVIVELGHRPDRRARRAHGVHLIDGDRGRDAFDPVDLRLVHAVEELARVGRERLDVAPLTFRVHGVERERRFARAATRPSPRSARGAAGRDRGRADCSAALRGCGSRCRSSGGSAAERCGTAPPRDELCRKQRARARELVTRA